MKSITVTITSGAACLFGAFFYLWLHEWIVIHRPQHATSVRKISSQKKNVLLHYWKNNSWYKESDEIMWPSQSCLAVQQLINRWLHLLEESELIAKHVGVESVAQAPNHQTLYISFDRYPLSKEWSMFRKWMFIEGLLKTIREQSPSFREILFLIRHQPMHDIHLDFSHPWHISGYLERPLQ